MTTTLCQFRKGISEYMENVIDFIKVGATEPVCYDVIPYEVPRDTFVPYTVYLSRSFQGTFYLGR